ncbi:MAG: hypothetical protein ACRDFX_03430, partial [Chloroflexota bacterium]
NGFLIGETVAASLTIPFILPLVGHHWEGAFAFWSLPVLITAATLFALTPQPVRSEDVAPVRWWPDWRDARTWRLGLVLGCASLAYFGSNAFIPDYLKATHHSALTSAALTSLNFSQVPSSILTALFPGYLIARRWPIVFAGALTLISAIGFRLGGGYVVLFAGTLGFSTALVFVLSLALPPLLAEAHDVHRLTAAMFTITYVCPFIGSLVGGAVWDATGIPVTAFVAVAAAGLLMMVLGGGLHLPAGLRDTPVPAAL